MGVTRRLRFGGQTCIHRGSLCSLSVKSLNPHTHTVTHSGQTHTPTDTHYWVDQQRQGSEPRGLGHDHKGGPRRKTS